MIYSVFMEIVGRSRSTKLLFVLRELLLAGGIIVLLFVVSTQLIAHLENTNPQNDFSSYKSTGSIVNTNFDSEAQRYQERAESFHPVVASLGVHELTLQHMVSNHVMIFTGMPVDEYNAIPLAQALAKDLHELRRHELVPIVIAEPDSHWGLLDFREFQQGLYEKAIRRYFEILQQEGITEDMLGIWVPFPEPNVPNWNHTESTPADFGAAVNTYINGLRSVYPNARTGILLNSLTYEPNDESWDTGQSLSLIPYVEHIQPGTVDWVGLQGFPWTPRRGRVATAIHGAEQFLNAAMIEEAAEKLGTKRIWFNTGTYSAKYTNDETSYIVLDTQTRMSIVRSIVTEVLVAKSQGFEVMVNIFAEDKSATPEATDWSYLPNNHNATDQQHILSTLVRGLQEGGVTISFFDK